VSSSKKPRTATVTPLRPTVRLGQFPERVEAVEFPEPYAPLTVSLWCNPPQALLAKATADMPIPALLVQVVRNWNIADEAGKVLPLTEENLGQLPTDIPRPGTPSAAGTDAKGS
jgi:hypothetical protein